MSTEFSITMKVERLKALASDCQGVAAVIIGWRKNAPGNPQIGNPRQNNRQKVFPGSVSPTVALHNI